MPKFMVKLDKILDKVEVYCVGLSTCAFALLMFTNVILRNVFNSGISWSNELSSYLNIFGVYIAVAAGFKFGDHVGVEAVVNAFDKKIRKHLDCFGNVVCLGFVIFIAYHAFRMVQNSILTGQVSLVLHFPMSVVYSFILIGMIGSVIRIIMNIVKIYYKGNEKGESEKC